MGKAYEFVIRKYATEVNLYKSELFQEILEMVFCICLFCTHFDWHVYLEVIRIGKQVSLNYD